MMSNNDDGEQELVLLWNIISEISAELSRNRSLANNIHAAVHNAKHKAIHQQTGFVLRRFNTDKPQDAYDRELEAMNATLTADNVALVNDNRTINGLIKEYEGALDEIMAAFRTSAHDVQQRELSLIRKYENQLLTLDDADSARDLEVSTAVSLSLARMSQALRFMLRSLGGEDAKAMKSIMDPSPPPVDVRGQGKATEDVSMSEGGDKEVTTVIEEEEEEEEEDMYPDPEVAEWALDRETELARLETENTSLRKLLGWLPEENLTNAARVAARAAEDERQRHSEEARACQLQEARARQADEGTDKMLRSIQASYVRGGNQGGTIRGPPQGVQPMMMGGQQHPRPQQQQQPQYGGNPNMGQPQYRPFPSDQSPQNQSPQHQYMQAQPQQGQQQQQYTHQENLYGQQQQQRFQQPQFHQQAPSYQQQQQQGPYGTFRGSAGPRRGGGSM